MGGLKVGADTKSEARNRAVMVLSRYSMNGARRMMEWSGLDWA